METPSSPQPSLILLFETLGGNEEEENAEQGRGYGQRGNNVYHLYFFYPLIFFFYFLGRTEISLSHKRPRTQMRGPLPYNDKMGWIPRYPFSTASFHCGFVPHGFPS